MSANSKRFLVFYVSIALIIKIAFFAVIYVTNLQESPEKYILNNDAVEYYDFATYLYEHHTFNPERSHNTAPLYPIFLSFLIFLFGKTLWLFVVVQIIIHVFSGVFCYKIAREIFSEKIARVAAILFMLDIHLFLATFKTNTETLFILLFLISTLYLIKAFKQKKYSYWLIGSILLSICTITRPIFFYYPIGITILLIICYRDTIIQKIKVVATFGIISYSLAFSWMLNNYQTYGYFQISSLQGVNLLLYHAAYAEAHKTNRPIDSIRVDFLNEVKKERKDSVTNPFEFSSMCQAHAVKYLGQNVKHYLEAYFQGIVLMYCQLSTVEVMETVGKPATRVSEELFITKSFITKIKLFFKLKSSAEIYIGLLILVTLIIYYSGILLGLFYLVKERRFGFIYLLILAIMFYFTAITGPMGLVRYRMPMIPFYSMLAAFGYLSLFTKGKTAKQQEVTT